MCISDVDKGQLFDLNQDSGETTNLFGSEQHRNIVRRLTERIHRWQEKVQDKIKV